MATDYAEKERVFIASLEADTGRALDAWMQAIADSGMTNRNDIIDWLRQSGFTFSNASWLERIHHNGGRLVYADDVPPPMSPAPPRPAASRAKAEPPPLPLPPESAVGNALSNGHAAEVSIGAPVLTVVAPAALPITAAAGEVLLAAKGLRPLANLALQHIAAAVPETTFTPDGPLLILSAPKPYLALLPGAKALRFYGAFGGGKHERIARAEAAMKITSKTPPPFPNVLVLIDARLVDETFVSLAKLAHAEAHA